MNYEQDLLNHYQTYQKKQFENSDLYFVATDDDKRPVFMPQYEWLNVISNPNANKEEILALLELIPVKERHQWFRSFNSSQALAISVLGNLKLYNKLDYLNEIKDDEFNETLLINSPPFPIIRFEHKVDYFKERTQSSIDAFFPGVYQVAIECKFTEGEIGACTTEHCNGSYTIQDNRKNRCYLTEREITYWKYIPELFNWEVDIDYSKCPMKETYQLVRNVLAACVIDGEAKEDNGHALLVYDERNPAFQKNGKGSIAYSFTKDGLKNKKLLRKCSWQKIVNHLRTKQELDWLTKEINLKYGI